MRKIPSGQKHDAQTFMYSGSRALERASFYGLRSFLVVYMMHELKGSGTVEISSYYGIFLSCIYIFQVIGGILGDLAFGNRNAMLAGGLLQALGAFAFCIPNTAGVWLGMGLIVLGTGLYSPNILSLFGKSYLKKNELTDAGFTLFYTAINIGAYIGYSVLALFSTNYMQTGFLVAGVLMLVSVAIAFFAKTPTGEIAPAAGIPIEKRVVAIFVAILLAGTFWAMYENAASGTEFLKQQYATIASSGAMFNAFDALSVIIIGTAVAVVSTFYWFPHLVKALVGFLMGAAGFGVLLLIPAHSGIATQLFLLSGLLLGIAEIMLAPTVFSVITKNASPKYLASLMALSFIPVFAVQKVIDFAPVDTSTTLFAAVALSIVSWVILVLAIVIPKNRYENPKKPQ